nr:hypothetical protein CFP56_37172 [Quercus suber]
MAAYPDERIRVTSSEMVHRSLTSLSCMMFDVEPRGYEKGGRIGRRRAGRSFYAATTGNRREVCAFWCHGIIQAWRGYKQLAELLQGERSTAVPCMNVHDTNIGWSWQGEKGMRKEKRSRQMRIWYRTVCIGCFLVDEISWRSLGLHSKAGQMLKGLHLHLISRPTSRSHRTADSQSIGLYCSDGKTSRQSMHARYGDVVRVHDLQHSVQDKSKSASDTSTKPPDQTVTGRSMAFGGGLLVTEPIRQQHLHPRNIIAPLSCRPDSGDNEERLSAAQFSVHG